MKTTSTTALFLILFISGLAAQTNTEIYLFDFKKKGYNFELSNPVNISKNVGYDNQPSFLPDGSAILFASSQDGQSDVIKYDIATGKKTKLTDTPGSEYSPTITPGGKHFSAILLEEDGTQLLWKYPLGGSPATIAVPNLKIGYHCWVDNNKVISFVLTEPEFTMQISDIKAGVNKIVETNPGRSFHKIPRKSTFSFIDKKSEEAWFIKSFDPSSEKTRTIIATLAGVEDMAWTADGSIIMGQHEKLYKYKPGIDLDWEDVTSLQQYELNGITRIAISPKGDKIAIVVNE